MQAHKYQRFGAGALVMLYFGLGCFVGGAACSAASWFYYTHALAAKVDAAVASVKASAAAVAKVV